MTREQAIALAQAKLIEHSGTFHKLRPSEEVFLTPLFGFDVASEAEFESSVKAAFEAN